MWRPLVIVRSWWRKSRAFFRVTRQVSSPDWTQEDFAKQIRSILTRAQSTLELTVTTECFWRMEGLAADRLRKGGDLFDLRKPELPLEARPITHCGVGIAAGELVGFDLTAIADLLEEITDPWYRPFCFEGIGTLLGVYEPGPFLSLSRVLAKLRILTLQSHVPPSLDELCQGRDPEVIRLISHGYGRARYFRNHTLEAAVKDVADHPQLDGPAAVKGIAFAWAMINSRDLKRMLERVGDWHGTPVGDMLLDGMTYALVFWEWFAPGFLKDLEPSEERAVEMVERAREEMQISLARGYPLAFQLTHAGSEPARRNLPRSKRPPPR